MREDVWSHYGTWWAVAAWIVMFGAFILFVPFYKKADRKPAGAFLAFIVAFALEMFGAPLSLYFVMWAFGRSLPEGWLWGHTLIGSVGMAGHYIYLGLLLLGGILVVAGWARIHREYWSKDEGSGRLVREGLYRYIRHPQYTGFLLISLAVLFEWATIPLLVLWPCLAVLYYRLAKKEEAELARFFGSLWEEYTAVTGMFLPRLIKTRSRGAKRLSTQGKAAALLAALALAAAPRGLGAEGLSWNSYAEAGLGLSLAGGKARPVMALDSGLVFGNLELGTYLSILPLEFGSPDLIQAGAVHYGTTIGARLPEALGSASPFGRIALGGVVRDQADEEGGFDGRNAARSFSASLVLGMELPLGGRWSARAWGAYRLVPGAEDFQGGNLSGPDFGLSLRAVWETTLR